MAVGLPLKTTYANGDVYSASDVNDTNGTVNATAAPFAAGKNKVINGDFGVWQRGTSFTTNGVYTADRFNINRNGSGSTVTVSRQNFTPGTAPVAGYEGKFFFRFAQTVAGTGATSNVINLPIEDVQTFAGQTMTLSFWAKADAARTITVAPYQIFGSGGSTFVAVTTQSITTTTSWARYSLTFSIPSISGKTVGTSSYFLLEFQLPLNTTQTIDLWGFQAENGSTATPFQTATGTIQGELAACQRYYFRMNGNGSYNPVGFGYSDSTTVARMYVTTPPMRVLPTSIDYTNLSIVADAIYNSTGASIGASSPNMVRVDLTGLSGLTAFRSYALLLQNTANQFLGFSSEL